MGKLGDMIKARRLELSKTIQEVAAEVGVQKTTVQRWESGAIKEMRISNMRALSRVLYIDQNKLVQLFIVEQMKGRG